MAGWKLQIFHKLQTHYRVILNVRYPPDGIDGETIVEIAVIPAQVFSQVEDKCSEGLVLAQASEDDGAIMTIRWCNKAFTTITGHDKSEVVGQRGIILIGRDLEQGVHLHIIEKLMNWENFCVKTLNNRKNGELYWQRMNWSHLSDPETGYHWWLCSIIDLGNENTEPERQIANAPVATSQDGHEKLVARLDRLKKENTRLYELAKSVARDANEDALTGLSNRRHFEIELKTWVADLSENGTEFAALYVDLDRFKFVNDTLGHDAGDRLLIAVARLLRELTSDTDLVARLGGDEFIILKPLVKSALTISGLADEIVARMQAPFSCDGKSTACGASVGVALAKASMDDPEQVVADADSALYHAKSQGKGRWSFFTEEMRARSIATKKQASDLLVACERREFIPYFQPVIDARTGRIASAEMLVRWSHPTKGILAPALFLETAANMGLLKRIDEIIFSCVDGALSRFDQAGVDLPRVAINVSAARVADPSFIHDIKSSGIRPERLTVEILESVFLDRMGDVVRWTIDELDELGVTIALDDFGTGHASVQGLLQIRPHILKIDRHFIQLVVTDAEIKPLVASIIGIGKSLGMSVVAEGVETEAHARIVKDMGCDYLQGFYFGKPMSEDDLCKRLIDTGGKFWSDESRNETGTLSRRAV